MMRWNTKEKNKKGVRGNPIKGRTCRGEKDMSNVSSCKKIKRARRQEG